MSKKVIAPSSLDGAMSNEVIAPSSLDGAMSKKVIAPSSLDGAMSKKVSAPSSLDGAMSKKVIAPSNEDGAIASEASTPASSIGARGSFARGPAYHPGKVRPIRRASALFVLACAFGALAAACSGADAQLPDQAGDSGGDGAASTGADAAKPTGTACVPGQQVACACPGGGEGAQACMSDGTGYGRCLGCGAPPVDATAPEDATSGGDATVSEDATSNDATPPADANDSGNPGDSSPPADAADATAPEDASDSATPTDASHEGAADGALPDAGAPDASHPDAALPDAGDAGSCTMVSIPAHAQPVYMLFVVDGSGSMMESNKWTAAVGALDATFGQMQSSNDDGLGAGLIVFSDSNDPTQGNGPYPSSVDVPIAFVDSTQQGKLDARVNSAQPSGATPTGGALTGAYGELASFAPASPLIAGGKKVVVLITDGVPTDNCATSGLGTDNYAQNACVVQAGTELKTASPQGPIQTFVIGVGVLTPLDYTQFDPKFLGALAVAGGGSATLGCNPAETTPGAKDFCYFQIDPSGAEAATQAAFQAAIDAIRGQVSSCTVPLAPQGEASPADVNVLLDGTLVPQEPTNGWTYDNPASPREVILHGTSCSTLTSTPGATIEFLVGCPTQK
jgi:Mg-chelatase subunit ChlD